MGVEEFVNIPIVSETDPSVGAPEGWCHDGIEWWNTTDRCLYRRSGSSWVKILDPYLNVPLTGTLTIDGITTVTQTVNNPTKIKVHKGLIVEIS